MVASLCSLDFQGLHGYPIRKVINKCVNYECVYSSTDDFTYWPPVGHKEFAKYLGEETHCQWETASETFSPVRETLV